MIYICGDSFCVPDLEYGHMWVDLLCSHQEIKNLARVAASNLQIAVQVDHALDQGAKAIIVNFTSSTRQEWRMTSSRQSLYEQYQSGDLISYAVPTCSNLTQLLTVDQIDRLRRSYLETTDLEVEIYRNKCVIECTLYKLSNSGCAWIFSSGGFEHSSFGSTTRYFDDFAANRSVINLWDHAKSRSYRPYYHITDPAVHTKIAEYYLSWLKQNEC